MSNISKRSLTASKEGVQLASRAILKFPTKIDFAAELEISRSTVQNFFAGKPVGRENFHKICKELDLCWQDVAELPQQLSKTVINTAETEFSTDINKAFSPTESCFQVRSRVKYTCSTMRVLDMSSPMSTEDIYVDINVYEKIKGRQRLEYESINEAYETNSLSRLNLLNFEEVKQRQIAGLEAARRYSKLMVLGKPGAGKTMFLKYLTLQCINGKFAPERIAIFISLKDYAESNSPLNLVDYIAWHLIKDGRAAEREEVKLLLERGRFFIAIDGLDEVKPDEHKDVYRYLRWFTEWYPNNHYVISCRHGVECCNFEQFTEVEIADFQFQQIVNFATKWFDFDNVNKGLNFIQKLEDSTSIQELATNPLLLTLLCISFDERSANFPASRSEIYEEALDIMLKQWDSDRSIERETCCSLSLQQEKELLYVMALKTFEQKQYFFKQTELETYIANYLSRFSITKESKFSGKKLLKSIEVKYGLLVERAKKVYSFSHLALQEYLTARNFVFENTSPASIAMLQHLVKHLNEDRWHEIFLLVAEMSPQTDELFQLMNEAAVFQIEQTPKLKSFLDWIDCKVESVDTQFQPATTRAFYFSLGLSQIFGHIGSNFSLALSLEPNFGRIIRLNHELTLDLSLCHIANLTRNLEFISCPALTFQRSFNRAIAHALKIKPELAKELNSIKKELPREDDDATLFWLWWHKSGKAWSDNLNAVFVKYRNIGYEWQFNYQQQQILKQYYQANLLIVNSLNCSRYVSPEVSEAILKTLLTSTKIEFEKAKSSNMELVVRQSIA